MQSVLGLKTACKCRFFFRCYFLSSSLLQPSAWFDTDGFACCILPASYFYLKTDGYRVTEHVKLFIGWICLFRLVVLVISHFSPPSLPLCDHLPPQHFDCCCLGSLSCLLYSIIGYEWVFWRHFSHKQAVRSLWYLGSSLGFTFSEVAMY